MIIFSSILTSIDVLISKLYQKQNNSSILYGGLKFNFFVGLFSSIIFLIINKFHIEFTLFSCISAVVMTAIAVIYIIIGFKILDCGKAAHYTFFRMTGAMIVPYIWGLCFLNEKFSFMRIIGLILIITAVFLVNSDRSNVNLKNILMYITVFFLAGCVSVISKQHSISVNAVSPLGYVILTSFVKIILWGRIVTIGSVNQYNQHPELSLYGVTKAAQKKMVENFAPILAPFGITVNNVAPGAIDTPRNKEALKDTSFKKKVENSIPCGFIGESKDVAPAVLLLCSDEGRYITGAEIKIDGGMSL